MATIAGWNTSQPRLSRRKPGVLPGEAHRRPGPRGLFENTPVAPTANAGPPRVLHTAATSRERPCKARTGSEPTLPTAHLSVLKAPSGAPHGLAKKQCQPFCHPSYVGRGQHFPNSISSTPVRWEPGPSVVPPGKRGDSERSNDLPEATQLVRGSLGANPGSPTCAPAPSDDAGPVALPSGKWQMDPPLPKAPFPHWENGLHVFHGSQDWAGATPKTPWPDLLSSVTLGPRPRRPMPLCAACLLLMVPPIPTPELLYCGPKTGSTQNARLG